MMQAWTKLIWDYYHLSGLYLMRAEGKSLPEYADLSAVETEIKRLEAEIAQLEAEDARLNQAAEIS